MNSVRLRRYSYHGRFVLTSLLRGGEYKHTNRQGGSVVLTVKMDTENISLLLLKQ